MNKFFEQIYPRYFLYEPTNVFKVVYFDTKHEYRRYTGSDAYGYYSPSTKTLTTYSHSGHGTLWHELIHAFMDTNIDHETQQWFDEGFASFYEMAFLSNGKVIEGYTNWRMPYLQDVIRQKKFTPLVSFMKKDWMTEDHGYAEARFLFCYLWTQKKMTAFIQQYMYKLAPKYKGEELGVMAIKTMEELIGKDIKTIEKEYLDFAQRVKKNQKLYQK